MQSTRESDEALGKEKVVIQVDSAEEETNSGNSEMETMSVQESSTESSHSGIKSAPDAFKILMNESVLFALSKDYTTKMNILRAIGDAFCEKGQFSWVRSGKLTGALAIGVFASIFAINPTTTAAQTLTDAFKQQTGIDISYGLIIMRLMQIFNTGGSAALATFSGLNLIETYLGHTSAAEKFLKFDAGTCEETSKKIGRKIFDLLCAIASSVPSFFLTESSSVPLALLTAAANSAINWLGVSSLPLTRSRIHPARRVELAYLNEQIETFLKLPATRQDAILTMIKALQKPKMRDSDYKQIYARLLNLAKPDQAATTASILIQIEEMPSCPKQAFAIALGCYITVSQIAFTEATYAGISRLFSDTSSAPAIGSGAIAAAFSILPNVGFGFFTGYNAANAVTSNNMPLAKLYLARAREGIKYTIFILSLFAGGTTFTVALNAEKDLANLASISGDLQSTLQVITGAIAYSSGAMITAYYSLRLCDEILNFLAQRCADEHTRSLFTFVLETRRMHKILSESTNENYLEILRWKMTNCKELSTLLHTIFKERFSEAEYKSVQKDLNKSRVVMRDLDKVADYQTSASFVKDTPVLQLQHPGLRRRKCLVFCCDGAESASVATSAPVASVTV